MKKFWIFICIVIVFTTIISFVYCADINNNENLNKTNTKEDNKTEAIDELEFIESIESKEPTEHTKHLEPTESEEPIDSIETSKEIQEEEKKEATISMVGDMTFVKSVDTNIKKHGEGYILEGYGPYMKKSDIVLGNLETSVSLRGKAMENKEYTFRSSPAALKALKDNNFTAVSIANNHVLDYGRDAFSDTLNNLDKVGMLYAGGGRNKKEANAGVIIEKNGITVGFLAFSKVIPKVDWYATNIRSGIIGSYKVHEKEFVALIKEIKKNCDVLVVSVHWGKEYATAIRDEEKYIGHSMIDAGADVIMGHHPHVVQGLEIYKDKPIFYSLGNFIFYGFKNKLCNKTIMAEFKVNKKAEITNISIMPGNIINGRPIPMEGSEKEEFLKYFNKLSINYKIN